MTTLEILKAARELISVPERWTQHEYARDFHGNPVSALSPLAVCWCLNGALQRVKTEPGPSYATKALREVLGKYGPNPSEFNDTQNHPDVLALFDRAIAKLENSP
jgi:hypothetical protein